MRHVVVVLVDEERRSSGVVVVCGVVVREESVSRIVEDGEVKVVFTDEAEL